MKIQGIPRRSIEIVPGRETVQILDQTLLPHEIEWRELSTLASVVEAIKTMQVRGAPLIGATAAYGYFFALRDDSSDAMTVRAYDQLLATRPTAVNLRWALDRVRRVVVSLGPEARAAAAWAEAGAICEEEVRTNRDIGVHGLELLRQVAGRKPPDSGPLQIMTHCNAGWLACVDWGTAIAPIYQAYDAGLDLHVWVSETRPRGQGASLTAWELGQHAVPHTLVVDNEAGHLSQRGLVDLMIVGADRVTARGDAANKIGTYLKALAARAHNIPFYVALPASTIDWTIEDGIRGIPIEQRAGREVTHVGGLAADGRRQEVLITPAGTAARNDAFDVTPGGLITGLVTEHGVFKARAEGLARLAAALGRG
jgi:methylthioribose-1-phosphate isomerase